MTLRTLCRYLEEVAEKNGDEFEGIMHLNLAMCRDASGRRRAFIRFVEKAEKHDFIGTAFEADVMDLEVDATPQSINEACDSWAYQRPEKFK